MFSIQTFSCLIGRKQKTISRLPNITLLAKPTRRYSGIFVHLSFNVASSFKITLTVVLGLTNLLYKND